MGYWSQQSRGHADSAKAAKPTWDGWVSAQAFILWWGYCLYVAISTLLGYSQKSCSDSARLHWLSLCSHSLQAGSFSLSTSSEGSPAVCLSVTGISDLLQRTFSGTLMKPNYHPKTSLCLGWPASEQEASYNSSHLERFSFISSSALHLSWNHISLSLPLFHKFLLLLLLASLCIYSIYVVKHFQIQDWAILFCFKWYCRMSSTCVKLCSEQAAEWPSAEGSGLAVNKSGCNTLLWDGP